MKQKHADINQKEDINQNELDKACFQHEMAYRAYKDLEIIYKELEKICLKDQSRIKYCLIQHLMLQKIRNIVDIKEA